MLKVESFEVGALATNCYIITDCASGQCAVIDPGAESGLLTAAMEKLPENMVKYVLLTHGHFDHIGYAAEVAAGVGAQIVIGKNEEEFLSDGMLNLSLVMGIELAPLKADVLVGEGDTVKLGETDIEVIELPGHTKGGIGYFADGKLFCGDTLFKGSMGRTDFQSGDERKLLQSLKKLSQLPDKTVVYSGHGGSSTIGEEKCSNSCMQYAMRNF